MSGQCVDPTDPCAGFDCFTPPPVSCDGDTLVRPRTPGTCEVNVAGAPECVYDTDRVDCTADGDVCVNGACVEPDPCLGVDCSVPPPPACGSLTVVETYAPGVCRAGECEYPIIRDDCNAGSTDTNPLDNACSMGTCIERPECFGVVCDAPPVDSCLGDTLRRYEPAGVCEADRCIYEREDIDCTASDQICQAGACVTPTACTGLTCTDPPESLCAGQVSIVFASPGVCTDGLCDYDEISSDCAAAGGYCQDGVCEFFAACDDVDCSTLPRPACDDVNTVIEYRAPGDGVTCREGLCQFDEVLLDCAPGTACDDGVCEEIDPCAGVTCERAPFCDGETAVTTLARGVCEAGTCSYDGLEERDDCLAADLACLDGACVEAGFFLNPGDLVVSEFANGFAGEDYSWFELTSTSPTPLDLSGVTVMIDDESITIPRGTRLDAFGTLIFNNSVFEPAGASGLEYETVLGDTFSIVVSGAEEIDALVVDATWPRASGASTQLDINALFIGNDDALDWCLTDDLAYGSETPGDISGPCTTALGPEELLLSEIMALGFFSGTLEQWLEFYVSGSGGELAGARLVVDDQIWTFPPTTVAVNDTYMVIAASRFMAATTPSATWADAIELPTVDMAIRVFYGDRTLSALDFFESNGWEEIADAYSLQLGADLGADELDIPEAWCFATEADEYAPGNYGTPGAPSSCSVD